MSKPIQETEITVTTTGSRSSTRASKKSAPPPLSAFSTEAAPAMKLKKVALIFNPVSGNKKGKKRVDKIVMPLLQKAGVEVVSMPTERAGHAVELAATADLAGCDALLALGGDGTLSDVTTGMMQRQKNSGGDIPLGFLPGGTGNTVCHDLFGKRCRGDAGIRAAVQVILDGRTRKIDCCKVETVDDDGKPQVRHSINIVTCGLGVDANAAAEKRRWMGPARYDVSIVLELLKIAKRKPLPCTLEVDGTSKPLDLFVLTIMNNKHSGVGLRISPYAQMDDGKIDVMYTPEPIKKVAAALRLDGMIKKKGIHVLDPLVAYETATSTIKLTSEQPVKCMCDGDTCGNTPLLMTVEPKALTVFTKEYPFPC